MGSTVGTACNGQDRCTLRVGETLNTKSAYNTEYAIYNKPSVGETEGKSVGDRVGLLVGFTVGSADGFTVGSVVGYEAETSADECTLWTFHHIKALPIPSQMKHSSLLQSSSLIIAS